MKSALATVLTLGLCTVALAGEKTASGADTQPVPPAAAVSAPPAQTDSPLVAAAKRANRKGRRPANVITNQTLNKTGTGAHITTTQRQQPFAVPKPVAAPRPTPEMIHAENLRQEQKRAAAAAGSVAKAEAARAKEKAAAAASGEEGLFDETDPAETEGTQGEPTQQKPPRR